MTKHKDKKSLFYTIPRMRSLLHRGEGLFYRKWRLISRIKAYNLTNYDKYYHISYLRYRVRNSVPKGFTYFDSDSCKPR